MLFWAITCVKGFTPGLEFKRFKLCGPTNQKNVEFKASPWPFIPFRTRYNFTLVFIPDEAIFAATSEYKVWIEPGGQLYLRGTEDVCSQNEKFCSLAAGEKFVLKHSDILRTFPTGLKVNFGAELKIFNQEYKMVFCASCEATLRSWRDCLCYQQFKYLVKINVNPEVQIS